MALTEKLKRWIPTKRKIMQLYFAVLFNANLKGFVSGNIYKGNTKAMCVPGLNCYSCPGAVGACPLGSLQGSFSADRSTLYYVCGILVLYGVLFGRMICGWLCPFGLIQDLLHKIKTPKVGKSPVTRLLSGLKYVVLVFFVLVVPITYAFRDTPLPAFCKYICPAGTLEGGLSLLANEVNDSYFSMLGPLFTWKFLVMVSILVGCVFVFRLFCRFLCPLGALYSLFNRISLFGVKLESAKCTDCGLCISKCKLDIRRVGDRECVSCGECVDVCPTKAIVWKGPAVFVKKNEGETAAPAPKKRTVTRIVAAVVMLAVLVGTVGYYWVTAPDAATVGTEVGDMCYSYDLPIITADAITDATINPTETGKITIVNFWGTWCSGCVAELPYFDKIASAYADTVTVVAVHTNMIAETAPAFIESYYPDSAIVFAKDDGEAFKELYYTALGGRDSYPYTVVLDENGIIRNVYVSSVTYKDLQSAVDALL
ncbi:MAG: 4Fe-4S binding protein [Clostridia bacterium]|nr:4Fe-4S binding protein [Clostridia bacterium]